MDDACSAERVTHSAYDPADQPQVLPSVGTFDCDVLSGTWTWSDEIFRIHGFEPGEVRPTADLLLAHVHPDDLTHVQHTFIRALEVGAPFACYHRLLDARRAVRHVLVAGGGEVDGDGRVASLSGFLVDLTQVRREDLEASIAEAVRRSAENRPAIEQAKGALMLAHGLDEAAAFEVLRDASQDHNVKLHRLAEEFVAQLAGRQPATESVTAAHALLQGSIDRAAWSAEPTVTEPS